MISNDRRPLELVADFIHSAPSSRSANRTIASMTAGSRSRIAHALISRANSARWSGVNGVRPKNDVMIMPQPPLPDCLAAFSMWPQLTQTMVRRGSRRNRFASICQNRHIAELWVTLAQVDVAVSLVICDSASIPRRKDDAAGPGPCAIVDDR